MDIFDFINRMNDGDASSGGMITITMSRENVKELVVITAIDGAAVDKVLHDYRTKLDAKDLAGLENAVLFGKSMIHILSVIGQFTGKELEDKLDEVLKIGKEMPSNVHFNKSTEGFDDSVRSMFGDKGT